MGFGKAVKCFTVGYTAPDASPCEDQLTAGGVNPFHQGVEQAAPRIDALLQGVRDRSPKARVLVLTYPQVLPPGDGCYPWVPIAKGDVPFLRDAETTLNAMLRARAAAAGATIVDTSADGHDACQPEASKRWVEGIPTQWAAPAHPNQNGEAAMAALTLAVLAS
jgi:hypothetical protein